MGPSVIIFSFICFVVWLLLRFYDSFVWISGVCTVRKMFTNKSILNEHLVYSYNYNKITIHDWSISFLKSTECDLQRILGKTQRKCLVRVSFHYCSYILFIH